MSLTTSSPEALQILSEIGFDSLPSHWEIVRIEELLAQDRGIAVGVMYPGDHDPEGIPIIKAGDLSGNIINPRPEFKITPEKHYEYRRTELSGGELILSLVGDVGRCAVVPERMKGWNTARATAVIRLSDPSDALFVRVCFLSTPIQHLMKAWSTTTVQATLNLKEIRQIPIPWPPKKERDRIAEIAGALDDKIELNRRMNETLEAMARALFQSWFIDFDPVHAKAAGRKPEGLDAATAKLFPSEFALSSVGRIPKGWKVGKLSEHVEAMKGLSYKGEGLAEAGIGIPLHNLNSVYEGGGYKFSGIKWYTGEYKERHLIRPGDLIVANTEQGHDCLLLGYAAIVPEIYGDPAIFSHHLYRLRVRDESPVTVEFLCRMLNSPQMHDLVSGYGNGTTVNMLPADGLQVPEFVVPPPQLIQRYSEYAESVRKRCERFVVENHDLAATRDALLPRLLSCEMTINI